MTAKPGCEEIRARFFTKENATAFIEGIQEGQPVFLTGLKLFLPLTV